VSTEILLVEDNPGDARLLRETFLGVNSSVHLHVVCDGVEGLAFLRYQGEYINVPRPDLILLDLNLPKMDGREFLTHVKKDPRLSTIPIIVLTTSQAEVDIVKSYELQANCYLTKPWELSEFGSLVKSLNDFWIQRASLPKRFSDPVACQDAPGAALGTLLNHVDLLTEELKGLRGTINELPTDDPCRPELEKSLQALLNVVTGVKADLAPTSAHATAAMRPVL